MGSQLGQPLGRRAGLLVAGFGGFGHAGLAVLHHFQIAEDQLGVDGLDVADGVHAALHMDHIGAVKAAHHVHNGVALPDVAQKLVAQALALGGALYQAGDVHKFHNGRGLFVGVPDFRQLVQTGIGHGHNAGVGVDGAEGVVRRLRIFGAGNGVEQSTFAHVGQAHDTEFHSSLYLL